MMETASRPITVLCLAAKSAASLKNGMAICIGSILSGTFRFLGQPKTKFLQEICSAKITAFFVYAISSLRSSSEENIFSLFPYQIDCMEEIKSFLFLFRSFFHLVIYSKLSYGESGIILEGAISNP